MGREARVRKQRGPNKEHLTAVELRDERLLGARLDRIGLVRPNLTVEAAELLAKRKAPAGRRLRPNWG